MKTERTRKPSTANSMGVVVTACSHVQYVKTSTLAASEGDAESHSSITCTGATVVTTVHSLDRTT